MAAALKPSSFRRSTAKLTSGTASDIPTAAAMVGSTGPLMPLCCSSRPPLKPIASSR